MITYSSSFLQFLEKSESRIAKILWRININYPYYADKYKNIVTTDKLNYITFRKDGTISFLPAGKEHKYTEDDEWARDGRQSGKPGKVVQKLFTEKMLRIIPNKEFETFSNSYKAAYNSDGYTFHLFWNKKIPLVYDMKRRPGGGRLEGSCMNNDKSYLELYAKCEKLKILVLQDTEGRLCGRALVWFIDKDFILMDRIYTSDDFMDEMFLDYARDKGWHRKKHYKTFEYKTLFVTPTGTNIEKDLKVYTDTDCDYYPYIDTFSFGDDESLNNYGDGRYTYCDTGGGREDSDNDDHDDDEDDHEGQAWDELDERWIDEDEAYQIDRGRHRGLMTHRDNVVEVRNHWYWIESDEIVQIDDEWYHRDDTVYCEKDEETYLEEDCVCLKNGRWILKDEATEIDGMWYDNEDVVYSKYSNEDFLKEDCVFSERLKSWIKEEDAIRKQDGHWYHRDEFTEEELEDIENTPYLEKDDRLTITNDPNQILLPF